MENLTDSELTTLTTKTSYSEEDTGGSVEYEVPYLLTVILVATIGNTIVLLVYSKKSRRKSNSAYYIINLAIGDLFAAGVAVFHVTEFYPSTWWLLWRYDIQCILHRCCRYTAFNVTVFTMVAIAIDRYFAVCQPLKFKINFTLKRTKRIIAMLWITAVLTSVLESFNAKVKGTDVSSSGYVDKTKFACKSSSPWGDWFRYLKLTYVNVLLFYIPVVVTFTIYVCIIAKVWKRRHGIAKQSTSRDSKAHIRTTRTLFIVFIAYVGCYVWFATYKIILLFDKQSLTALVKSLGNMIPFCNSCLNPIIYSFTNVTFRKQVVELFCKRFDNQNKRNENGKPRSNVYTDDVSKQTVVSEINSNCPALREITDGHNKGVKPEEGRLSEFSGKTEL